MLGSTGFEGYQTFDFDLSGLTGVADSDFIAAGVRAQNYCATGTLPNGSCGGSDKAYASLRDPDQDGGLTVPEPMSVSLLGIGLLGMGLSRKTRKQ